MAANQLVPAPEVVTLQNVCREFPVHTWRQTLFTLARAALTGTRIREPHRVALADINLTVCKGEKIAVIGNNAAGKSTLLKVIAGLLRPTSGTVSTTGDIV